MGKHGRQVRVYITTSDSEHDPGEPTSERSGPYREPFG
jgi:hypothetical protein